MKKDEFIKAVAETAIEREIKVSQETVRKLLDVIEYTIDEVILTEDTVNIMGMKFESVEKKESTGKSPRTGEVWFKPAHKSAKVSFLTSKKKSLEREI